MSGRWLVGGRSESEHGQSGSATVIAAFGMVAIMGMLSLAFTVGQMRYQQRGLQRLADTAAVASVLEIPYCAGSSNCTVMRNAATSALSENGVTASNVVMNCGAIPATGLTVEINAPPCGQGSKDPYNGKAGNVEVYVSQPQASVFAGTMGLGPTTLTARAEAAATGNTNCIYALDPTGSGALTVGAGASITSPCGVVVESSSSSAVSCALLGVIAVSKLTVVGGVSNFLCAISPAAKTGATVPQPADPLAYLPTPTVPSCGTTTTSPFHGAPSAINITGNATLYADGAYCGGITINSGATVSFQPGTYVLTSMNGGSTRSPGGLTINLGTNVTGTGVTFYNQGPSGGILFNAPSLSLAGVNLVAPTSGTYAGILFFQPATNTSPANLYGSALYNTVLQGAYYFPGATVNFCFNGPVNYNILVANRISFSLLTFGFTSVTSGFNNNYSSLLNGSPLAGVAAALSQ